MKDIKQHSIHELEAISNSVMGILADYTVQGDHMKMKALEAIVEIYKSGAKLTIKEPTNG